MTHSTFPCVDLKFEGNAMIKQGQTRKGVLKFVDEDRFHFYERNQNYVEHPELHWRLIDRSKHGRIHTNARHIKVEFYIRHDDYQDGRDLADILASEIETIGERLCEINIDKEVEKCRS